MNKKHTCNLRCPHTKQASKRKFGPSRLSGYLLMTGLPLVLAGCCDFAARIYEGIQTHEVGLWLRLGDAGVQILTSLAILLGGALLLEYIEQGRGPFSKK